MMVLLPDGASLDEILDARMMDEIEDCILAQQ
jgi:hypothetical protein